MKDLIKETNFEFTSDGLSIKAMDDSQISYCDIELKSDSMLHYKCERPIVLGINVESLLKVIRCADPEDTLKISYKLDSDVLQLRFENQLKIMEIELRLMEIDDERLECPDLEFECEVMMNSKEFATIIKDLQQLGGETCRIRAIDNCLEFSSQTENGLARISIPIQTKAEVYLDFILNKLKNFSNAMALSAKVWLRLSSGIPLLVEYPIEQNLGHIKYYLAPKEIDND
jgi:proliferating cell nuclear antigen